MALPGTRNISRAGFILFLMEVVEQIQKQGIPIRRTHTGTNLMRSPGNNATKENKL
jgi:hypothetical protein